MSLSTRISISVRSSPARALYFCVRLYSANPQGLPTVCWCSPPRALYFCVLECGASPNGLCVVRKPTKAFCFGVLYELQELCAVRAYKGFIQCAPGLVLLCTVRAPIALRGASLQRLCASVYRTSPKSFARCEPTKALCLCVLYEPHELCAGRVYKDFIQCAPGLVLLCTVRASRALCGASLQRLYTVRWCSPPTLCTECLCARAVV